MTTSTSSPSFRLDRRGQELRFREGQGTARIRIKTLNGDVNLCRK